VFKAIGKIIFYKIKTFNTIDYYLILKYRLKPVTKITDPPAIIGSIIARDSMTQDFNTV